MSDLLDKFTTAELASLFIGPSLVLVFCQTVETGVIIGQFITFWSNISSAHETFDVQNKIRNNGSLTSSTRLPKERGLMMMVSIYVLVITLVQTSFAISDGFSNLVDSFGKLPDALMVHPLTKLQPLINMLLSLPVQSFFIWRCWLLTQKNRYLLFLMTSLLISYVVLSIVLVSKHLALSEDQVVLKSTTLSVSTLAIPAVLDLLLSGILFTYLFRSSFVVVSKRFKKTLYALIIIVWEAAFPPCACAIISIVLFLDYKFKPWSMTFQAILGQLYVISFFVTLNGFLSVRRKELGTAPSTALGPGWGNVMHSRQESYVDGQRSLDVAITVDVQTTHDPSDPVGSTVARSLSSRITRPLKNGRRSVHLARVPESLSFQLSRKGGRDDQPNDEESDVKYAGDDSFNVVGSTKD